MDHNLLKREGHAYVFLGTISYHLSEYLTITDSLYKHYVDN